MALTWTGNIGRTVGHILLALGIIALVLGVLGLASGVYVLGKAADNPQFASDSDVGDILGFFVQGGLALVASGTLAVVVSLIVLGVARALRERLQRTLAATPAAT